MVFQYNPKSQQNKPINRAGSKESYYAVNLNVGAALVSKGTSPREFHLQETYTWYF